MFRNSVRHNSRIYFGDNREQTDAYVVHVLGSPAAFLGINVIMVLAHTLSIMCVSKQTLNRADMTSTEV